MQPECNNIVGDLLLKKSNNPTKKNYGKVRVTYEVEFVSILKPMDIVDVVNCERVIKETKELEIAK